MGVGRIINKMLHPAGFHLSSIRLASAAMQFRASPGREPQFAARTHSASASFTEIAFRDLQPHARPCRLAGWKPICRNPARLG